MTASKTSGLLNIKLEKKRLRPPAKWGKMDTPTLLNVPRHSLFVLDVRALDAAVVEVPLEPTGLLQEANNALFYPSLEKFLTVILENIRMKLIPEDCI